ncbi:hydantoinase/carbamoylase family amidase [Fodinicurvata fenggangensis]|uniref:hydantoinase/carbamoylase family amidase n=1 Tax=Fodinicurvata fenggangensis TaxID=1121830 RepID=UPI000555BBB5|nr:hydantoinase/carbamoylase family amidase [Fodinicurvata fenggangensis]
MTREKIEQSIEEIFEDISRIFKDIEDGSRDNLGVTRPSYGDGENFAHRYLSEYADELGLEVTKDASSNTYMTLPGQNRSAPRIIFGSHLDSVQDGGNFDGAAGVVAGLALIMILKKLNITPVCDVVAMGIRAEESVWFQVSYLGSRGALGALPEGALDAKRIDTGRTAREHIADCGGDPDALAQGKAYLSSSNVKFFVELHIEQAPSLIERDIPVGICTGVPGLFMYPDARIQGEYGHVGTPRVYRHDAAMAGAEFAMALDQEWARQEANGTQMAITFGRFHTDSAAHGMTTIPGEFCFSMDVRGYEPALIEHMERFVASTVQNIEANRNVKFKLGEKRAAAIGFTDQELEKALYESASKMNVPAVMMKSPASHDAGAFSAAGIPTGMVFVRNENGSHNPREKMSIEDFFQGVRTIIPWLLDEVTV